MTYLFIYSSLSLQMTKYATNIFNYTERSKSSVLLSAVNSEQALKTSDIPHEIFIYEHQLKDDINRVQKRAKLKNS